MGATVVVLAALAGCGSEYDPELCDVWQSIGVMEKNRTGYITEDKQAEIDTYCTR